MPASATPGLGYFLSRNRTRGRGNSDHRRARAIAARLLAAGLLGASQLSPAFAHGGNDHGSEGGQRPGDGTELLTIQPRAIPRTRGLYEVWLSDQANTGGLSLTAPNGSYGGKIRIYDAFDLERPTPIDNPLVLDVSTDLFPTALSTTQAHVSRMHGILPSPDSRFMALNFVASGHLGIVDGQSKKSVCLFRTTKTSTGHQNHMSFWSPKGDKLILANQNGRILERVDVVRDASGAVREFVFNASASLDFVGGSNRILDQPVAVDMDGVHGIGCRIEGAVADGQPTLTPSGQPKQSPLRPLNSVICPIPSSTGKHVFASLGGGGMFVVDIQATPMQITADYDLSTVNAAGCGGVEAGGFMHLATGTPGPNLSEFTVYRFGLDYPSAPAFSPPNSPAPLAVWADPDNGKLLPGSNRDAHGMALADDGLHVFDRVRNNVEVFPIQAPWDQLQPAYSYDLTRSGQCGTTAGSSTTNDPTPDLGDISPDGETIYIALRGPYPLTVSHAASGSCPGLGIIRRDPTTQEWTLAHVLPSTVLDYGQTRNNSDPHAVILRRNTSVPGPLPGLGVGLAVAFSRRLRRRISLRGGAAAGGSRPG
ncbi:MAG: hypothetical protein VKK43_06855 [Synechococcaceae cyanobacterium]|nr:hypothetical protein [Synechococcaceae cyanobacterium]